jgi:tRNA1Val (adenine37-N6)-methyltransferase
MIDYSQPDFYKFNEDSFKLISFIASKIKSAQAVLDMGAGSGVIGIELAQVMNPQYITFLEAQSEWKSYLEMNIKMCLKSEIVTEVVIDTFGNWNPVRKYDLIVSNPPYFLPGHGRSGHDPRRNIARSFILDDWNIFLQKMKLALSEKGFGFVVIKNDKRILDEIEKNKSELLIKYFPDNINIFLELSRLNID